MTRKRYITFQRGSSGRKKKYVKFQRIGRSSSGLIVNSRRRYGGKNQKGAGLIYFFKNLFS